MGKRGEIFSTFCRTEKRTYFFNVHENINNTHSISLVESKNDPYGSGYSRQSILIFSEDLDAFLQEMQKAVDFLRLEERKASKGRKFDSNEFKVDRINSKKDRSQFEYRSRSSHDRFRDGRDRSRDKDRDRGSGRRERNEPASDERRFRRDSSFDSRPRFSKKDNHSQEASLTTDEKND